MRRITTYWRMNWDYWFLVAAALLIALAVGALLGAIGDTVDQIKVGY